MFPFGYRPEGRGSHRKDSPPSPPSGETPRIHRTASVRACTFGRHCHVGARTRLAESTFEILMGNDVAPRKQFIVEGAYRLDAEQIDA